MRYDTKEEIEATGEWLMRIKDAETPEELMYVPTQLWKLGVAPSDVVDRLDYLRESTKNSAEDDQEVVEEEDHIESEDEQEPEEEKPAEEPEAPALPYDGYGAWEWNIPIEKVIEDSISAIFELSSNTPDFNDLVLEVRPMPKQPRARGKRARTDSAKTPLVRARELVSLSAGATE